MFQPNVIENLRQITLKLAQLGSDYGYDILPYTQQGLLKFSSLDLNHQSAIVSNLNTYVQFCESAVKSGIDLAKQNHLFTWWVIKELKLTPHSTVFSNLEPDDFIEIYTKDSIQIFRSFTLFQFLSYSAADITSYEWWELYERDPFTLKAMTDVVEKVLKDIITQPLFSMIPDHAVIEKFSRSRNTIWMRHKFSSALLDENGSLFGFINVFKVTDFVQGSSNKFNIQVHEQTT